MLSELLNQLYIMASENAARYDELKTSIRKITPDAEKLIQIIENESDDIERRIAFLETTIEELLAGADYSKCETINDIADVYAASIIRRAGLEPGTKKGRHMAAFCYLYMNSCSKPLTKRIRIIRPSWTSILSII